MGRRGGAALALGLWVSVGVLAAPDRQAPGRRCLLSQYRWLDPGALAGVKALRDHYEQANLSSTPRSCSLRPRRIRPPASPCARLRLVARGIADAWAAVSRLRSSSAAQFPGAGPTLELLAAVGRDVSACLERVGPGASGKLLRPRRRRPKALGAESPECRQATVIFGLLRLLTWDLWLVAQPRPCP